jgi:uncharacterized protein (DUF2147 family)
MKQKLAVVGAILTLCVLTGHGIMAINPVDVTSPEGLWKTIDDKTGKEKSIVRIWKENDQLLGKVETLFEKPDRVCDKCKGKKKDQPIIGMIILWNMVQKGDIWSGGTILDPKTGKEYRCKLSVIDKGEKLDVRGFIGFSLLGRTQTWIRVPPVNE